MKRSGVQGFSTLTEMYSAWMEFSVPATFYHYFLTMLKDKSKPDQNLLMNKEISSLRSGTHLYLKIKSSIEARQHSLHIISSTLPLLKDQETLSKPLLSSSEERQFLGYKKLFQSKQNPQQRGQNRQLRQLANHLVIYRKVTLQIIFLIHKWMAELMSLGYEGIMQFLYNNEDYLEEISDKTVPILTEYKDIFEFNPFFILRKEKATSQHVLVNDYLKISPQYAKNLYEGLNLLAQHHSNLLRAKMLGQKSLMPSQRRLEKSQSVDKVYENLLNGKEYHMVKDSYLKSEKLLSKQNSTMQNSQIHRNKSQVRILPSLEDTPTLPKQKDLKTNFIQRKYPVFFSDNTENELAKGNKKNNLADFLLQRRYSMNNEMIKAKKSIIFNEHFIGNEIINRNGKNKGEKVQQRCESGIISRRGNRQKQIKNRAKEDPNALQRSRKLAEDIKNTSDNSEAQIQSPINIDIDLNRSIQSLASEQTKLDFKVQKNIYPTNILRYLRELFRKELESERNLNRMTTQKIQKLAKALLAQREHITIYKIFQNPQKLKHSSLKKYIHDNPILIAWMVCKLYKDASTLEKTVDIVFLYQFHKFTTIQNTIIDHFEQVGYLNVKQNGTIVHQSNPPDHLQLEGNEVVRCKYKISPFASDEDIKDIIKSNVPLKMSRILKYHYYSKTSKYHKYCDHRSKEGTCSINYLFEHISKVFINNKPHIKVKIDTITRIKQCYKIYHHLNNKTFLIAATTIEDLKQMDKNLQKEHQQEMDQDQSFDQGKQPNLCEYNWVCFEQGKVMRKFVDQRNKPIINEFVWIDSNVPEVKSIALDKKDITGSDCLVLSQPYVLAIYGKDDQQGLKSLAVLDFSQ